MAAGSGDGTVTFGIWELQGEVEYALTKPEWEAWADS
jgi:hypothetical protein